MNNMINGLNRFPEEMEYQCFLLDKNNQVLTIGNPALNPKIWGLYKETISGQVSTDTRPETTVFVEQDEMEIKDLQAGKKSVAVFRLKNTGNRPLTITRVDTSCGCTVPSWDKRAVKTEEETEITVEIHPEEPGFFHKTIRVYCNVEKGVILLSIKGMINNLKEKRGGELSVLQGTTTSPSRISILKRKEVMGKGTKKIR